MNKRAAIFTGLALAAWLTSSGDQEKNTTAISTTGTINQQKSPVDSSDAVVNMRSPLATVLNTFPTSLHDATIQRYDIPGATKLLVHVRTNHFVPPSVLEALEQYAPSANTSKNASDNRQAIRNRVLEKYESVNTVNTQVYSILEQLAQRGFTTVREEGIEMGRTISRHDAISYHLNVLKLLSEHNYIVPEQYQDYYARAVQLQALPKGDDVKPSWQEFRYVPGGAMLLAAQGRITLLPTEPADAAERYPSATLDQYIGSMLGRMDESEDFILETAATHPDTVTILSFGGAHSFGGKESCGPEYQTGALSPRDNLAAWNKANDQKFSLIVITPKAYQELLPSDRKEPFRGQK